MDLATVMSVVQTLLSVLQRVELKEMCSSLGYNYKDQFDQLRSTVTTIRAVFRDAENKEDELTEEAQHWIQELKDAVYDADDLFDELLTLAKQKEQIKGGKPSKEVTLFFSRFNPIKIANDMSQRVKKIQKRLDQIANIHEKFGFKLNSEPIRRRREETCSYVYKKDNIIGREDDVEDILCHMLDESNVNQDVSFVTIVGIGGLGKTALAQLLYNDERVTDAFTLRVWACVSDHDQQHLDVEQILRKILTAATGQHQEGSNMEVLHKQVLDKLTSNKFFLVLDDVWNESRNDWLKLVDFLLGGQRGSWIVVTTRSHKTATSVGGALTHELQGLSKENSWQLFKNIAFGSEQPNPLENLVKIGEEIVEGCAGVPLAIRVAGSLLFGQDESKWLSVKNTGLFKHREGQEGIIPILKLSYNKLEYQLKSCFTYCALFPKDTVIPKNKLIRLWIANDFVVPLYGQRIEAAAEEYYSILLRRCFFEGVELDPYGEIVTCKMHDLMHDVAQKVAEKEVCISNVVTNDVFKKSRHASFIDYCSPPSFSSNTCIRSYLNCVDTSICTCHELDQASLKALLTKWTHLRVLDLRHRYLTCLPEAIGKLLHLRYLDLTWNMGLKVLPKSITKLYNLQTLRLCDCSSLKELPKDLRKLVNLRILDITSCYGLTNMPEGMGELSHLQVLPMFVINGSKISQQQWLNQLGELGKLDRLKGKLQIIIKVCGRAKEVTEDNQREGAYLMGKQHLNRLRIRVVGEVNDEGRTRLLEQLQPHPNLKDLWLDGSNNNPMLRMPEWGNNLAASLPNLIDLRVEHIDMQYLMCLGNLHHLKFLRLQFVKSLEYIYEDSVVRTSNEATTSVPHHDGLPTAKGLEVLFPCLEVIHLLSLPKLKGWRISRVGVADNEHQHQQDTANMTQQLSLPQLKILVVKSCPDLICTLICPNLEYLGLEKFNTQLKVIDDEKTKASAPASSSSHVCSKLSEVTIDNVSWLNSFPREALQCLMELSISGEEVKSLAEAEELFRDSLFSLQKLKIEYCPILESVWCGQLEHLIALKELDIQDCPNVRLLGNEDTGDNNSACLKSLRTLTLACASQLVDLEHWIPFLEGLQSLRISSCNGLEYLPNWMPKLTSLTELSLGECSASLQERCQRTTGQDWRYIQHISSIRLSDYECYCS